MPWEGTSSSNCSGRPDGVCGPSHRTRAFFHSLCLVPSIMIAWGMIMTLMCLVNTYQGLIMCETRVISFSTVSAHLVQSSHLSRTSRRGVVPWRGILSFSLVSSSDASQADRNFLLRCYNLWSVQWHACVFSSTLGRVSYLLFEVVAIR
jgi:hypothetical protein